MISQSHERDQMKLEMFAIIKHINSYKNHNELASCPARMASSKNRK